MLKGTDKEVEYHAQRAAAEYGLYELSDDLTVASAHLALSNMHKTRFELADALRALAPGANAGSIDRTDKEG